MTEEKFRLLSEFGRVCKRKKLLGSQVEADGGCERDVVHRINEGYRAFVVLKIMQNNRGFRINAKKCSYI